VTVQAEGPPGGNAAAGGGSPTVQPVVALVTVYGRMPVLEALADGGPEVERVLVARNARGDTVDDIVAAARHRGVPLQRVAPEKVTRVSGNGRHDQGVVADVVAPGLGELGHWLDERPGHAEAAVMVLDGVTNPANVGMIVRTVTAAGLDALVLPRAGSPDVGPLVVKASAGVAFRATILRCDTAAAGLHLLASRGFSVVGLRADDAPGLFTAPLPPRAAFVLGAEHGGISADAAARVDAWRSIPLHHDVESLNVAVTAGIVAYEVVRRRA
jgi:23S rRNA (guanosine2251-2'-O)-methyltransferase